MTPIAEFRWLECETGTSYGNENACVTKTVRILQQKWVMQVFNGHGLAHNTDRFEWRDVPVVKEQT